MTAGNCEIPTATQFVVCYSFKTEQQKNKKMKLEP